MATANQKAHAKRIAAQDKAAKQGTPILLSDTVLPVEYGSKQHEIMISIGYDGMMLADAKTIIKERAEKPELWPWEQFKRAQAVIAANGAKPIVVSTRAGWKRSEV